MPARPFTKAKVMFQRHGLYLEPTAWFCWTCSALENYAACAACRAKGHDAGDLPAEQGIQAAGQEAPGNL